MDQKKIEGHKGQFLHAKKLEFYHPRTHEFMSFECDLPSYFQDFLKQIK